MPTISDPNQTDIADFIPVETMSQEQCLAEIQRLTQHMKDGAYRDGVPADRIEPNARLAQRVFALTRRVRRLQFPLKGV